MILVARHQRSTPLIRLLIRLGWQRDPELWTVRCRDQHSQRARVFVSLSAAGVALASTSPGPLELTPLEVGQLRGALRDALLTLDRLAGEERVGVRTPTPRRAQPPRAVPSSRPRQQVRLDRLTRPSVAEIISRLTTPPSDVEVNHEHPDDHASHPCLDSRVVA